MTRNAILSRKLPLAHRLRLMQLPLLPGTPLSQHSLNLPQLFPWSCLWQTSGNNHHHSLSPMPPPSEEKQKCSQHNKIGENHLQQVKAAITPRAPPAIKTPSPAVSFQMTKSTCHNLLCKHSHLGSLEPIPRLLLTAL